MATDLPINVLTERIIAACIEVHRHLGPGLLESVYERCVVHELEASIPCAQQLAVPIRYKDVALDGVFRIDVLVDHRVILELKVVEQLLPVHHAQVISYLRLADMPVGLLVNFHAARSEL